MAIVLAGLTLKFLEPTLYAFGTVYDDQLMVQMAQGFLHGHWSSSWAATGFATLVKPVGYPIFLVAVHIFPWSPVFSAYILYVIGVGLIAWSWFRMRRSRPQVTLLLAVLIFNPVAFTAQSERVYRDLFIMALFTLAVGVAFLLASLLHDWGMDTRPRGMRVQLALRLGVSAPRRWAVVFTLVVILGLIVGFAAITKETWVWLLPAAVAPLVYPFLQRFHSLRFRPFAVLRATLAGLVFLSCVWGVTEITKQLNRQNYQVAVVDELSAGGLAQAWKAWASVEAGPPEKYVPITRAMRLAVYRVSPTAAEMEPFLETGNDQWKAADCQALRICDESGPWFEWDLLSGAVQTGKVNSVYQIQTYFTQIADDIESACHRGQLKCSHSPVLATGLPTLNQIPLLTVASDTAHGLWQMMWDPLPTARAPYAGAKVTPTIRADYKMWASVVPEMPPLAKFTVWTTSVGINPILSVIDSAYRVADLALLVGIIVAIAAWIIALVRLKMKGGREKRSHPDPEGGLIAILFLISTLIGMGTLAVFAAAQDPAYITVVYWTDFSSVAQLCLIIGFFSLVPLWQHRRHIHHHTDPPQPEIRIAPSDRVGAGVE